MNKKLILTIVAVAAVGVLAISLFQKNNKPPGTRSIKLGTILGLTGNNASYGQKMQRGFQFALDEINGSGGVKGATVELAIEDSQFDPTKAVSAYRKLTGAQGIRVIVGITGSKNALPVCEASKGDDVVIIDALGSAPKLTTHGGPNYFRVMASDALAGSYNVEWGTGSGMKKPVIAYMEDDWGASYRDSVSSHLAKKGFADARSHGVTAGTRDFRSQIEKIKGDMPDTLFLLLYAKEGATFMQQLRQAGVPATVYGSDNISSAEFGGAGNDVVEGVRVAMPTPAKGELYDEFVRKYQAKFGEAPDANVIKSYDVMKLVCAAVAAVGANPSDIKKYLRSPNFKFDGVSGPIKFDEHGDLVSQQYTRMVYKSGKLVPLQ